MEQMIIKSEQKSHELTTITDTSTVTSKQILAWARWVEVWQSYTELLDSLKEINGFDAIKPEKVGSI